MRILFASDIHGSPDHWEAIAAFAKSAKPDALLLGGDLFSNTAEIARAPAAQRQEAEGPFAGWCGTIPAPVYWIAGNHEWAHTVDPVPAAGTYIHGKCIALGNWDLLGFSLCSPTPYWLIDNERRERNPNRQEPRNRCWASEGAAPTMVPNPDAWLAARPTLADELELLPAPRNWRRTIFMAHNPPFSTGLDTRWGNAPVGSTDIRDFILAREPGISLHGHIHEAPTLTGSSLHKVGRTLGYNAGRPTRGVRALLIDLAKPAEARVLEA